MLAQSTSRSTCTRQVRRATDVVVGMPDRAVRESRARIKSALTVTINLAPANVRKGGAGFDLPMARSAAAGDWQPPGSARERAEASLVEGVRVFGIQPDMNWCGGLTELRRIGALASAYDIPVIPHGGGLNGAIHWIIANVNAPWAELFMPAPGGPEGIYTRPSDSPGFGWDFEVAR